jgi:hypothetical protein
MQGKALLVALAGSCSIITGCASAPTMKYATYTSGSTSGTDQQGSIKFYLYGSIVTLVDGSATPAPAPTPGQTNNSNPKAPPDPATQAKTLLKASIPVHIPDVQALKARPAQAVVSKKIDTTTLYALVPDEKFYFKPNISVTYVTNSYAIKTLGAAAEDDRVKIITAIGGILTAAAPLLAADAAPQAASPPLPPAVQTIPLPVVIDLTPVDFSVSAPGSCVFSGSDEQAPATHWCPITGTGGSWEYVVKIKQLTPGMVDRAMFFEGATTSSVRIFPVPSCQDARLSVRKKGTTESMDFDITVANPQRLGTFLVPFKGSITPGDICGADLTVTSSNSSTASDIANAVATQAAAVEKAIKAADPTTKSAPTTTTKPAKP